jgi:hypothetical protein
MFTINHPERRSSKNRILWNGKKSSFFSCKYTNKIFVTFRYRDEDSTTERTTVLIKLSSQVLRRNGV